MGNKVERICTFNRGFFFSTMWIRITGLVHAGSLETSGIRFDPADQGGLSAVKVEVRVVLNRTRRHIERGKVSETLIGRSPCSAARSNH